MITRHTPPKPRCTACNGPTGGPEHCTTSACISMCQCGHEYYRHLPGHGCAICPLHCHGRHEFDPDPYPPGTRVVHRNQGWAYSFPGGAGEILQAKGSLRDGSCKYLVRTSLDANSRPGPHNPETHETWWPSDRVRRAAQEK